MTAVVDANVLIDYKDTGAGVRHQRAERIVHGIDRGDLPTTHVPESVLLETLNWIHERQRHDIAVDLRQRLAASAGFELVPSTRTDFHRGMDVFDSYEALSFGDAALVAYMERTGLTQLYSFDDDFDAFGQITRLDTADDANN